MPDKTNEAEKTCTKCGETKPLTEFYRNREKPDGRLNHCKACHRPLVKAAREKNPEAHKSKARRGKGKDWFAEEDRLGPAGRLIRPHKPRCHFGRQHRWVECESIYGPGSQCESCGAVSSDHPDADQPLPMMDSAERFWEKVEKGDGDSCWEWKASVSPTGYGEFKLDGRPFRAHRVAYELLVGPIPEGLVIDHLCRNTVCVNPAHLDPVTNQVNIQRSRLTADEHRALAQQDQVTGGVGEAAIDAAECARVLMEEGEEEKAHVVLEKLKWQREARCTICGGPLEGAEGPECDSVGCPGREDGEAN